MDARTYNIRDTAGYLVFATDDQDEFLQEADRRAAENADSLFEGGDPDQLRKDRERAAEARQTGEQQQRAEAERVEERAVTLAADPDALAKAVAELETRLGPFNSEVAAGG